MLGFLLEIITISNNFASKSNPNNKKCYKKVTFDNFGDDMGENRQK